MDLEKLFSETHALTGVKLFDGNVIHLSLHSEKLSNNFQAATGMGVIEDTGVVMLRRGPGYFFLLSAVRHLVSEIRVWLSTNRLSPKGGPLREF